MGVTRVRQWLRRIPAGVLDMAVAAWAAVVIAAAISVASEAGARPPDVPAYALGLTVAVALLFRRRRPLAVLVVSVLALGLYHVLGYPGMSLAFPLAVALYSAATAGHLRWGLLFGAVVFSGGLVYRVAVEREAVLLVLGGTIGEVAIWGAALFLGDAVRSRRAWTDEVRERLRLAEVDREREARRRVAEERLRIARELHDVMAHTVAVIAVQAGVAADVLDSDPGEARAALGSIRTATREAMAELRATLGVLRAGDDADAPLEPAPGLGQIDDLVARSNAAGLRVDLEAAGDARVLPAAVDLTAYRVVQESLTNVVRHAHATTATVSVRYEPSAVVVEVRDDGRGPDGPDAGHGLTGMGERVAALGGRFEAGPGSAGGFRVRAHLPTRQAIA
jgi:signal transduction histidine kinase